MGFMCGIQTDALALSAQTYIPIFAYDETANILYFIDKNNNNVAICTDGSGACSFALPFNVSGGMNIDANGHTTFLGAYTPTITGTCGVGSGSPGITGNDTLHTVSWGGNAANTCAVTFGHAYTVAPKCFVFPVVQSAVAQVTLSGIPTVNGYSILLSANNTNDIMDVLCLGN